MCRVCQCFQENFIILLSDYLSISLSIQTIASVKNKRKVKKKWENMDDDIKNDRNIYMIRMSNVDHIEIA